MFGSTGSMFGSKPFSSTSTTGSLFGNTSSTSNAFGFNSAANEGPDGSTIPFEPLRSTDTMVKNGDSREIQTKLFCITAMDKYKMKCPEELRVADYLANRKGPQATSSGIFGGSSNTAGTSMFGNTAAKPIFGSGATNSTFGSGTTNTTSNAFGSPFGAGANKTGFGMSTTPSTGGSIFGNTNNQTTSTNLFGQNQSSFGQPAANTGTTGSLFGQNKPAFGSTTTGTSIFGNTASNTGNAFGQPAQSNTGSAFGFGGTNTAAQQPATGGFGSTFGSTNNTNASNPFGTKPAGTFASFPQPGTNTNTTGSFFGGGNTNTSNGLFNKPATGGLFQTPTSSANTIFGGNQQNTGTSGGLFNTMPQKPAGGFGFGGQQAGFGTTAQQPATTNVMSAPAAQPIMLCDVNEWNLTRTILEAQLANSPYGDRPFIKETASSKAKSPGEKATDNSDAQQRLRKLAQEVLSSPEADKLDKFNKFSKVSNQSLLMASTPPNSSFSYKPLVDLPNFGFAPVEKRSSLNISHRGVVPRFSSNDSNSSSTADSSFKSFDPSVLHSKKSTPMTPRYSTDPHRKTVSFADDSAIGTPVALSVPLSTPQPASNLETSVTKSPNTSITTPTSPEPPTRGASFNRSLGSPASDSENVRPQIQSSPVTLATGGNVTAGDISFAVGNASICEDDGYYTIPKLEILQAGFKNGKVHITDGLTVGRVGYGSVFWAGEFDLSTLNFADIIHFRRQEIVVYPDDSTKPPLGEDLNRPAEVSLECVWPVDKQTRERVKDPVVLAKLNFTARLERACQRMHASFVDYMPSSGTWRFNVSHFSKYGFVDDEEDDTEVLSAKEVSALQTLKNKSVAVQRAKVPFREIHQNPNTPAAGDASNFFGIDGKPVGLGGFSVKVENTVHKVDLNEEVEPDLKKLRMDPALLVSFTDRSTKPTNFVKKPLVSRDPVNIGRLAIDEKKSVLYGFPSQHWRSRTTWMAVPRVSWTSQSALAFVIRKSGVVMKGHIEYVPLLTEYFEKYLKQARREGDFEVIVSSRALRCNPASVLVRLLDRYVRELAKDSTRTQQQKDASIMRLCDSLLLPPNTPKIGVEQRRRFSHWIRAELAPKLKNTLYELPTNTQEATRLIYTCLVHGNVKEAADTALKAQLYHLALTLPLFQSSTPGLVRDALADQVQELARIFRGKEDPYMVKILELLAGPRFDGRRPRCYEGLTWMQSLGCFLWYGSFSGDGLDDWMTLFERAQSVGIVPPL